MIWVIEGKIPKNNRYGVDDPPHPTNNICPEIKLSHYLIYAGRYVPTVPYLITKIMGKSSMSMRAKVVLSTYFVHYIATRSKKIGIYLGN